ncbi:uncharacterized protein H6S33_011680 [Morchella sextelata]|uniref:uncharacterized protein n=1 Tax=Morchella sextelata TaxID=1174677 RepID=UPI001D046796|nr:uncharacterized protein H6S33_011680 [Morchella sextelata]KAH0611253.1 hypothetical protein H6S33_011680 [Morchella sextelata]
MTAVVRQLEETNAKKKSVQYPHNSIPPLNPAFPQVEEDDSSMIDIRAEDSDYEEEKHWINTKGLRHRNRQQDATDDLDPKYIRKYPLDVRLAYPNFLQGTIWTPAGIAAKRAADALTVAGAGGGRGSGGGGSHSGGGVGGGGSGLGPPPPPGGCTSGGSAGDSDGGGDDGFHGSTSRGTGLRRVALVRNVLLVSIGFC